MTNPLTSKTLDDIEYDKDGTYAFDCCNAEYCEKHKRQYQYDFRCLLVTRFPRCTREVKWEIRQSAKSKGFRFSDYVLGEK